MYLPAYHAMQDTAAMLQHIAEHPLGAWVCHSQGQLLANHIPFVVDTQVGAKGTLVGHVSRANLVWRELAQGVPSVVMFVGPQAYITPNWYPSKQSHGQVVPTWNYVTVHVHGMARAVDDAQWFIRMLHTLTNHQERHQPMPWQLSDAPADYLATLQRAIVGIEITIERMEGRLKASQDEEHADRWGSIQGLHRLEDTQAHAMAQVMAQASPTPSIPPDGTAPSAPPVR